MLSELGRAGCLERAWRAWGASGSALATRPLPRTPWMGRVAGDPRTEERANSLGEFGRFPLQNGVKVADLDSPASQADLPSYREDSSEPR